MKGILTLAVCLVMSASSLLFAQNRQVPGTFNVFSDGEPFYLYINNILYNDQPSRQVRVEGIYDRMIDVRIEYTTRSRQSVSARDINLYSENGYFLEVTYMLNRKSSVHKLVLFTLFPVEDFPQPDFYAQSVYRYGHPRVVHEHDIDGTYRLQPISDQEFASVLNSVKKETFSDDKFKLIRIIAPSTRLSVGQIEQIVKLFSLTDDKVNVAKELYKSCVDKHNYHLLIGSLQYSSDRTALADFVVMQQQGAPVYGYTAMNAQEFDALLKGVKKISFSDDKFSYLNMVRHFAGLSVNQIAELIKAFSFSDEKLRVAQDFYRTCIDKHNYHQLMSSLQFVTDRNELADFLLKEQQKNNR